MPTIVFDTYAYIKKLQAVGFTEEQAAAQAETFASLIDEQLATKRDLKELEMALRREIEDVRRDMKEMEMRIIIKLGAMMAASIAVVATLVKLL